MKAQPDYTVLFSDEHIAVFNKRSGLNVAADRYDAESPRLDLLAEKDFGKLYAVHRIDKDTSGVIIYARTKDAHRFLSMQFENRSVKKEYHCLVRGRPLWQNLRVDLPLLPDGDSRHRTVVNKKSGKYSLTEFFMIGVCGPYSWIKAVPETGRTHQIRVHLAQSGLSIVCDSLYSGNLKPVRLSELKRNWHGDELSEAPLLERLALHAYKLELNHPITKESLVFVAPYQKDMDATRKQLAKIYGVDPLKDIQLKNDNKI
ncbi:MAG: RluA family pseudouridine synthase [Treponema sp.]|nr:RluA family pseudouridine synthase [Treponema sp.]